jgi:magnesium transporter
MQRYHKTDRKDIGLSPYALIYRGQKRVDINDIKIIKYNHDNVSEIEFDSTDVNQIIQMKDTSGWWNVNGLDNIALMESLSERFHIDKNIISDIMNPSNRPKVQEFENGIFLMFKLLHKADVSDRLMADNLSIVLSSSALLSFQEQKGTFFDPVRERIRKPSTKIRNADYDYLTFALIDVVVDHYIYQIGLLGDKIEDLDEQISNDPTHDTLEKINFYKRELIFVRKSIKPAKEVILTLNKMESDFIKPENKIHFRELQDNINEAIELADSYHEILYDLLNTYHSSVSTKLNEIMRVLTIISVIFIPITFLVGVYGTNFDFIPELHFRYGYAFLWLVMILTSLFMIWFFRRKKWL